MLIIMENWDVHERLELLFDIETIRPLNIFEVNSTEGWSKISYTVNEGIRILCIHVDVNGLNALVDSRVDLTLAGCCDSW